jgi:transposase-like protein
MPSTLTAPHFHDEEAAYAWVESRVWPAGPVCPHCKGSERISKLQGKSTRIGVYKCYACRKPFTVKVGTIFEASHLGLHLWLQAMFLMCSSKKGISSNQLARTLGITLKSAWFLSHRIREAMRDGGLLPPMGSNGNAVEADETYYGAKDHITTRTKKGKPGLASKRAIVSLVQRGGEVRSFYVERATQDEVTGIVRANVAKEATLYTDESRLYDAAEALVAERQSVKHSVGEYVRGEIHTNTVEGYFSIFKRGMRGIYQWCSERHLHRYLAEYDYRYSYRIKTGYDDAARFGLVLTRVSGKRLTYRTTGVGTAGVAG